MSTFVVLLRKDLREQWRTLRLPVVAVIFLLVGLGSPLLAKYTPELLQRFSGDIQITVPTPTTADAIDQFLKNLGQTAPFAAILLAMGAVARERERGTAGLVLTKPVSRSGFLASKFLALTVTLGLAVLLAGMGAYLYTAALFETLSLGGFLALTLLLLLSTLVFAAITFLGSTLIGSSLPAAGLGLAGFVVVAILSAVPRVGQFTPFGLSAPARALALGEPTPHLLASLGGNLVLLVGLLAVTWLVFRRQEIGS